jgi:hypothetical protein
MTVEHRLSFGLSDIVAVTFVCKKCGIRLSVSPDKLNLDRLRECPSCKVGWLSDDTNALRGVPVQALARFVGTIAPAVHSEAQDELGVNVLLEFAEPKA